MVALSATSLSQPDVTFFVTSRPSRLMMSSTRMIISAASAAEQSCDILLRKDSMMPNLLGKTGWAGLGLGWKGLGLG